MDLLLDYFLHLVLASLSPVVCQIRLILLQSCACFLSYSTLFREVSKFASTMLVSYPFFLFVLVLPNYLPSPLHIPSLLLVPLHTWPLCVVHALCHPSYLQISLRISLLATLACPISVSHTCLCCHSIFTTIAPSKVHLFPHCLAYHTRHLFPSLLSSSCPPEPHLCVLDSNTLLYLVPALSHNLLLHHQV